MTICFITKLREVMSEDLSTIEALKKSIGKDYIEMNKLTLMIDQCVQEYMSEERFWRDCIKNDLKDKERILTEMIAAKDTCAKAEPKENIDKAQGAPVGMQASPIKFLVGQPVSKKGGDYRFDGLVVAAFTKISGEVRYVVEDDRGILHIYSDKNLTTLNYSSGA